MAQNKGKLTNEATRRSKDAATVFNEIMGAPDSAIPKELVDKAQAIAVFPSVLKAAFIFGGTEGKGIISRIFAQQGNIRGCGSEWHAITPDNKFVAAAAFGFVRCQTRQAMAGLNH